jgi:3D (Asp-Asp-Asp) domain-containing protein
MAIHGFPGGVISATAPTVSPTSASGVWTLDDQLQNSANWPTTNVLLNNSVRTRASASAYMTRTPTVTGNQQKWTWSGWIKRGTLGSQQKIFFAGASGTNFTSFEFISGNNFQLYSFIGAENAYLVSSQVFRDPSAWYHIIVAADTTQATASNRIKVYVNGTQITSFSPATYPSQNYNFPINSTVPHTIGRDNPNANNYFDGYLADINFVDGQALDPSYFGATNPNTGVWQPSQYKGTYGTNGFYLPMNIEVLQKSFTRSLRFRSSASAYLNRTPASASNQKTWTWSAWVKRGFTGDSQFLFSCWTANNDAGEFDIYINPTGNLIIQQWTASFRVTNAIYRDPAAWYHIVVAIDTTQATADNRVKLYINGSEVTSFSTTNNPTLNQDLAVNQAGAHYISSYKGSLYHLEGYMAEVNFIDGLALTPGYFGQTDSISGAWQPVGYTGQYGTNGFYLPFTNITSTSTLGLDASGRNNNWTTNNISLTAGATYDSMTDVPTLTDASTANYCVLNPLNKGSGVTLSAANLNATSSATYGTVLGTLGVASGKFYWEVLINSSDAANTVGIGDGNTDVSTYIGKNNNLGYTTGGQIYGPNDTTTQSGLATYTANDIIGVALNMDANEVKFYKNNSLVTTVTGLSATTWFPAVADNSGSSNLNVIANFGQRPFAYTPPTGFVALNAFNL